MILCFEVNGKRACVHIPDLVRRELGDIGPPDPGPLHWIESNFLPRPVADDLVLAASIQRLSQGLADTGLRMEFARVINAFVESVKLPDGVRIDTESNELASRA